MKPLIFSFLALFGLVSTAFAQKGTIRGGVFDNANGEALLGVTVQVKGTSLGNVTDLEGKFSIALDPGTYEIQISYISFQTVVISGVAVKAGEVTVLPNVMLKEDATTLEEVVVTAQILKETELAVLTTKRKAPNVLDGISSAKFRQIGDSDASDAVKRVTGVSVEGGKYVYVRGLGDRYTKTTLNSVDIPGLDPDRNSIQIDIFPTNLIDNLIVAKSPLAEMPADFTGGVVNIETKDFPESKVFNIGMGIGINPSMHFNNNFFMYKGGKTDWLGFDDGTRALPSAARNLPFPAPTSGGVQPQEVNNFLRSFNKTLSSDQKTSLMDYDLSLSMGNQKDLANGNSLGYTFSVTYKNSTVFYDDVTYGEYQRPLESNEYELVYATVQTGAVAEQNVLLGTLGGLAYKTNRSKYKLTLLHLQNGEKRAAKFFIDDNGSAVGKSGFTGGSDNLEFSERSVTNALLSGEHFSNNKKWNVNWKISPTLSRITEPDIRKTAFTYTSSDTVFSPGAAGNPSRIWRYLDEINLVARIDASRDYSLFNNPAVLKFGVSQMFKERDYEILSYDMQFLGSQPEFNGNPQVVLQDQYLYPNGTVYYSSGNTMPNANSYNSTVNNFAFYLSNQFEFTSKLKTILGLRAENFVQRHTGRDAIYGGGNITDGKNLDNAVVLDGLKLFPSANVIYALRDNQNLRLSYARTIARPSFKELSFAQILDPVSNRIFNGGLFRYPGWDGNLRETLIDNIDLRWELFIRKSELLSVSAFYKKFQDPIELVRIPQAQTTNEFQPRNVGDGQVLGLEVEFRKGLDFVSSSLKNLYFGGNITYVKSSIEMTSTEFDFRKAYLKDGEELSNTREMAGQAPYIINVGLSYEDAGSGIDGGIFYNVNGPTLTVVGGGIFPDVFSEPFHSVNFNINKTFGKATVSFSATNLLNDVRENFYEGFRAERQYYSSLNPGTAFKVGLKYQLF
jgi:outer membrane receptor protein involved in Fe transport